MSNSEFKRGGIYYADLPQYGEHVQDGLRPVVIVQNDVGNTHSGTLIVVPLTTQYKNKLPTHVYVGRFDGLKIGSTALCEQILTINKNMLKEYISQVTIETMSRINRALFISLGFCS